MKIVKFTAKVAHASKEDDYYMVGFSNDKYGYDSYIILQRAIEYDKQDIELGMDGEYLEVNGQENSGYKLCKKAFISNRKFIIEIDSTEEKIDGVEILLCDVKISKKLMNYLKEILGEKLEMNILE